MRLVTEPKALCCRLQIAPYVQQLTQHLFAGYFILGIMSAPNAFIYIGGGIILVATGIVTVAQHRRRTEAAAAARLSQPFSKVPSEELPIDDESEV